MSADPVVWFAGTSWDGVPGTDHRLVRHVAQRRPVIWVDPPFPWTSRRRLRSQGLVPPLPGLTTPSPGVTRLHSVAPPGVSKPGVRSFVQLRLARQVKQALTAVRATAAAVVVANPETRLSLIRATRKVYFVTDDFVSGARLMGISTRRVAATQQENVDGADVVVTVSGVLAATLHGTARRTVVLPNGCEPDHFSDVDRLPVPCDVTVKAPRAGVVGQLNDRLDFAILAAVADAGVSLLLVGPRYEQTEVARRQIDALVARSNVQWVGRKTFDELPAYLGAIEVGLTPYADNQFNRASFPLKTLEYLSAGRAVVSTDLPSARWLDSDLVDLATGIQEFVDHVLQRLSTPSSSEDRALRRTFARRHSWAQRARVLEELL